MPKNTDHSNMRQILLDFPSQFALGLEASAKVKVSGQFDNIIVCGMGGSAWPGELVNTYLIDLKIPLFVSRDYFLPKETTAKSLIFASSYSGDTEEMLSAYGEARKRNLTIVGFSKGGTLAKLCQEDGIPLAQYPDLGPSYQPRYATGLMFAAMVKVLSNSELVAPKDAEIKATASFLGQLDNEALGKKLAKELKNKIPLIYSSEQYKTIPFIWKIKFNETAKVMAFSERFPEMNHNDMTGFTLNKKQGKFFAFFLRNKNDHPRIQTRMNITAQLLESEGVRVIFLDSQGDTRLEQIFSLINLGDWITYYLALKYGIDPTPTDLQAAFKKQLSKI